MSALKLNGAQEQAVYHQGNLLITACPGSGKTAVLKERAIYKLRTDPKAQGVGVTFTKDAAKELQERIYLAFPEAATRFRVGTFHSLCIDQLKKARVSVHLADESLQNAYMYQAWKEVTFGFPGLSFDLARRYIESTKSKVDPIIPDGNVNPAAAVYYRYQNLLAQRDLKDFSDLVVFATRGMMSGDVAPIDANFLLVDEFQDTDPVGLGWVEAHRRAGLEVTVVGDDDQSVYGWRHAMGVDGMEQFRKQSGATHISLNTTYRCPQEVIKPAANLILENKSRIPKQLRTENRAKGTVRRLMAPTREEEINALIDAIEGSGRPADWGVLARSNKILDKAESLIGSKFEVSRNSGKGFWELRAPALYLGLCRSVAMDDLVGVDHVLRMSGVPEVRLSAILSQFGNRKAGALTSFIAHHDPQAHPSENWFKKVSKDWRKLSKAGLVENALSGMMEYLSHVELAPPTARNKEQIKERSLRHLDSARRAMSAIRGDLMSRVRYASQANDDTEDDEGGVPRVRLMTIHGSKGLEFPHVWMLACEDGVTPAKGSPLDEERRLFYVGMTRAKRTLTLSFSEGQRSQFIDEAGII